MEFSFEERKDEGNEIEINVDSINNYQDFYTAFTNTPIEQRLILKDKFKEIITSSLLQDLARILPGNINLGVIVRAFEVNIRNFEELVLTTEFSANMNFFQEYVSQFALEGIEKVIHDAVPNITDEAIDVGLNRVNIYSGLKVIRKFQKSQKIRNDYVYPNKIHAGNFKKISTNLLRNLGDSWSADTIQTANFVMDKNYKEIEWIVNSISFLLIHGFWQYLQFFRAVHNPENVKEVTRLDTETPRSLGISVIGSFSEIVEKRFEQMEGNELNLMQIPNSDLLAFIDYYKDIIQIQKLGTLRQKVSILNVFHMIKRLESGLLSILDKGINIREKFEQEIEDISSELKLNEIETETLRNIFLNNISKELNLSNR